MATATTDEKNALLGNPELPSHIETYHLQRKIARRMKQLWFTAILIFFLGFFTSQITNPLSYIYSRFRTPSGGEARDGPIQFFEDIIPSEKLQWQPCKGNLFCARLTVPMDYNRPLNASKDNPKVHLALVLGRGKHSKPNEFSKSPLLLNPGGPGGSGVEFATFFSQQIQYIVDPAQDVIGFDPRGIGSTTPRADCFSPYFQDKQGSPYDFGAFDALEGFWRRMVWTVQGREIGLINSTSKSLSKLDARDRLVGKLCEEQDAILGDNSIFRHASTPTVARDMISIIDAWDEWRDSLPSNSDTDEEEKVDEAAKYPLDTKGKLVYWGFSYGTLLGATFAALFPDRVGRVILDGVVDADLYVSPIWGESIIDADTIFESFPKYCHEGKANCGLYEEGDTLADVEDRFYGAQARLKVGPISFVSSSHTPIDFTYEDFRLLAFVSLYGPTHSGYQLIALIVTAIIREDFALIEALHGNFPKETFYAALPESLYPSDAQIAIMCGDKRYPLNESVPNLEKRYEKLLKTSSFADVWLTLMMGCDGWNIKQIDPPMKWGKHPAHQEQPINTSFPVLFLSNTYDPVTPLRAGLKMAEKFVDSGLVEQNSMGHCSLAAVSLCTLKKIKEYFTLGKVPSHPKLGKSFGEGEWEKCKAIEEPFKPISEEMFAASIEDQNMIKAGKEIQAGLKKFLVPDSHREFNMGMLRKAKDETGKYMTV